MPPAVFRNFVILDTNSTSGYSDVRKFFSIDVCKHKKNPDYFFVVFFWGGGGG